MKLSNDKHITKDGIVKNNPMVNNAKKLKKYYYGQKKYFNYEYFNIDNVPVSVAKTLTTGYPKLDLRDRQNDSPTAGELIKMAEDYDGKLLGYVVTGRPDSRITFDGVKIDVNDDRGDEIGKKLNADESSRDEETNLWRLWWD